MSNAARSVQPWRPEKKGASRSTLLIVLGVAAAVVIALVVAVAATGGDDDATVTAGGAVPTGAGTSPTQAVAVSGDALPPFADQNPDPAVGLVAPTIGGATFDGSSVSLQPGDGRRKFVLVVAHWCPHCQREIPVVADWIADGKLPADMDVVVVSTSVDPAGGNFPPQDWLAEEGWPFPVIADSGGLQAAQALGTQSFPYLVVLDAEGKVTARASGGQDSGSLDALAATSA
jgi:cytochrome c biogenesis protein CcmG, thiol:disulfide interchange protein DsbE